MDLVEEAGYLLLVSRLLAAPPDAETAHDAITVGLLESMPLEDLQVEYTRLFSAPGSDAVPVFQSIYTDLLQMEAADPAKGCGGCGTAFPGGEFRGHLGGISTTELQRWYADSGFQPPVNEMADHISVELSFLAHLMYCEARASDAGEDTAPWSGLSKAFYARFLDRWLGEFTQRLTQNATAKGGYRPLANALAKFQNN